MLEFVNSQRVVPRVTDEALRCAFALADNPHIHRDRRAERDDAVLPIEAAYANRTLVCMMWSFLRRKAVKLGYEPFGNARCG